MVSKTYLINNFFSLNYFFNLLRAMELKVILGAMVSLKSYPSSSKNLQQGSYQADLITSTTVLVVYIAVLLLFALLVLRRRQARRLNKLQDLEDFNSIYSALSLEKEFNTSKEKKGVEEIFLLSWLWADLLIPAALVILVESATQQIIFLLIIN